MTCTSKDKSCLRLRQKTKAAYVYVKDKSRLRFQLTALMTCTSKVKSWLRFPLTALMMCTSKDKSCLRFLRQWPRVWDSSPEGRSRGRPRDWGCPRRRSRARPAPGPSASWSGLPPSGPRGHAPSLAWPAKTDHVCNMVIQTLRYIHELFE